MKTIYDTAVHTPVQYGLMFNILREMVIGEYGEHYWKDIWCVCVCDVSVHARCVCVCVCACVCVHMCGV